jgi:hypothetical protein
MIDLQFDDTEGFRYPATLDEELSFEDLVDSQNQCISVQYNEIDLGESGYGFNQPFEGNEANLYFQRMHQFSEQSINEIKEDASYNLHFNRTDVRGNIKRIFDRINPQIAKANPLIFHFALDPNNKNQADRAKNIRNPRIYFMVGRAGMIHILFFDPYHEINP